MATRRRHLPAPRSSRFHSRLLKARHWSAEPGLRRPTGDCRICFATSHPLSPRLIPASSNWTYADPAFEVVLTFGENMDQTSQPLPADFVIDIDGVEKTPDTVTWDSATELSLDYNEAVLGPTVVRCRYSKINPDFESALFEKVTPFDILVTAP